MKIEFKAPGGEMLSFDAPEEADPALVQSTIDSVSKQYLEKYSPSQLRLKTGKPFVTSEADVHPSFMERMKKEASEGFSEIVDAVQKPGLLSGDPKNVDVDNLGGLPGAMKLVNAPLTAAGGVAGTKALDVTGSPAVAAGVDALTQTAALAAGGEAIGLAGKLRGRTRAAEVGAKAATAEAPIAALPEAGEAAPPIAPPKKVDFPSTHPLHSLQQTFDDLHKSMYDEAPPKTVFTQEGKKGKVQSSDATTAKVAHDDGVVTLENLDSLSLVHDEPPPPPVKLSPSDRRTKFMDEVQGRMGKFLEGESRDKLAPEQEATLTSIRDEKTLEKLGDRVNALKPPRKEALHSDMLTPEMGLKPAVNVGGRVVAGELGQSHNEVIRSLPNAEQVFKDILAGGKKKEAATFGYVDASGKFLTREEASKLHPERKVVPKGKQEAAVSVASGKRFVDQTGIDFLDSNKPVYFWNDLNPRKVLGERATELEKYPSLGNGIDRVWYKKGEKARAQSILDISAKRRDAGDLSTKPEIRQHHENLGKLLGYSKEKINSFLFEFDRRANDKGVIPYQDDSIKKTASAYGFKKKDDAFVGHGSKGQSVEIRPTGTGWVVSRDGKLFAEGPTGRGLGDATARALRGEEVASVLPKATAAEELRAEIPAIQAEARKAVRASRGKQEQLEDHEVNLGQRVGTTRGEGTVTDFDIDSEGQLIHEIKLDTGKTIKTPYVFRALTSEKGAVSTQIVSAPARALANKAVETAKNLDYWWRSWLNPAGVSGESKTMAALIRKNIGPMNANNAVAEYRLQEVDAFFDRFSHPEIVDFYQRYHFGVPQQGLYAKELDQIADSFRALTKRREAEYANFGWRDLTTDQRQVATLFKDQDRGNLFANIASARTKTMKTVTNELKGLSKVDSDKFFNDMMTQKPHSTPLRQRIDEEQIGRFFRGFKDPARAKMVYDRFYRTNKIAGTQKAHYDFFAEGVLSELEPVSWSPVRLVQNRMYQMNKAVMTENLLRDMKPYLRPVRKGDTLFGYKPLDAYDSPISAAELKRLGIQGPAYWHAPQDMARIVNNYFRPGLRGNKWYDVARDVSMLKTMSRLGISGFHGTEIALTSLITDAEQGWMELANKRGLDRLKGFKEVGTRIWKKGATGMVKENYDVGAGVAKEFLANWDTNTPVGAAVEHIVKSNLAIGHDVQYATQYTRAFKRALSEGGFMGYGKAALDAYPAILENMAKPMFDHLVPNIKIGAMMKKMEYALQDLPPGATHTQQLEAVAKVADEVDYAFGKINYDNLFFHNHFKDMLFVAMQAPGWFMGSVALAAGASKEVRESISDIFRGGAKLGSKTAFWLGVGVVHPIASAITQYALTGTFPQVVPNDLGQTMKNFLTHKTGRTNADGTPEIGILPGYHKEVAHMLHAMKYGVPGVFEYVAGKASGLVSEEVYQARNKDFFGNQIATPTRGSMFNPMTAIREPGAVAKNIGQRATHFVGSDLPISLQAMNKSSSTTDPHPYASRMTKLKRIGKGIESLDPTNPKNLRNIAGNLLGEVQAPAYMTRTPLEDFLVNSKESHGRTVEGAERAQQRFDLTNELRRAKTPEDKARVHRLAAKDDTLSDADKTRAARDATKTKLAGLSEHVPVKELLYGMELATPEQRRELLPIIIKKFGNTARNYPEEERKKMAAQLSQYMPQRTASQQGGMR